ncbi:sigma-70 family RNA polymerase sigma factor [Streptomyces sp. NBC_01304]|uniref:sigma-70 family RNA polymerase sigma factor n=1 Tax=Streptomyces sp. NBC_01304 TaxID=2903818 RepID=UPI002E113EB7|nr:sigma-70 family RNA polymerase sigma factor [Streptomyces sp. NBC_01304]WSJ90895.1 sigma-70 family RNA polymerase sigma factor [Streptomyces sp. NBC_01304]
MTPPPEPLSRGPNPTPPGSAPRKPSFTEFYSRTYPQLVAQACTYTASHDWALDAVQDAYVATYLRWDEVDNPTAYVATVTRRNIYSQTRLRSRITLTAHPEDTQDLQAPDQTETVDQQDMLLRALRQLPYMQRTALVMYYLETWTIDDLAAALDITPSTVRAHLTLGRRRLRKLLTTGHQPEPHTPPTNITEHKTPDTTPAPHRHEPFHDLYERYAGLVYDYIYFHTGNPTTTEHLTRETFRQAVSRTTRETGQDQDPHAWLITMARTLLTNQGTTPYGGRNRQHTALTPPSTTQDTPARPTAVLQALSALTPAQYECIVLRFHQGLSAAEAARIMDRTEAALRTLQQRALRTLAQNLEPGTTSPSNPGTPETPPRSPRSTNPPMLTRMMTALERLLPAPDIGLIH